MSTVYVTTSRSRGLYLSPTIDGRLKLFQLFNKIVLTNDTHLCQLLIDIGYKDGIHTRVLFTQSAMNKIIAITNIGTTLFTRYKNSLDDVNI